MTNDTQVRRAGGVDPSRGCPLEAWMLRTACLA
jgi:hypothetical protein